MATQTLSHPVHGFNPATNHNTFQSLMAARQRLGRMTALDLQAEILNERLAAGLPTDDVIFVNVDGMRDPGPDFTAKAWR